MNINPIPMELEAGVLGPLCGERNPNPKPPSPLSSGGRWGVTTPVTKFSQKNYKNFLQLSFKDKKNKTS